MDPIDATTVGEAEEAPLPLMQLSNELLAGVTQRLSEKARRRFECVDERAAAVTRAHGSVHRHDLVVVLTAAEKEDQMVEAIQVGELPMDPGSAPAAVRSLLARRRRITRLTLDVDKYFDVLDFWGERARRAVGSIVDILLDSDRLQLTTVKIDVSFVLDLEVVEVKSGVARLLQRHASTIVDVSLLPCVIDWFYYQHSHVELCQAVAACIGMQRFTLHPGFGCLEEVLPDCVHCFTQLRVLHVDFGYMDERRAFDVTVLPKPSLIEELHLNGYWSDGLLVAAQTRGDVFASLRALSVIWYNAHDDSLDGLLEFSPRLEKLRVEGCLDKDVLECARSLVGQFFAGDGGRQMRFVLVDEQLPETGFAAFCAALLTAVHAAAPDAAIACSDAQVFVLGARGILKAAIAADATKLAAMVRALVESSAAAAAVVGPLLPLLSNVAMDVGDVLDLAAVVPYCAAMMEAVGERVELASDLANEQDDDEAEVVFRLSRGHGADERQLDLYVCFSAT